MVLGWGGLAGDLEQQRFVALTVTWNLCGFGTYVTGVGPIGQIFRTRFCGGRSDVVVYFCGFGTFVIGVGPAVRNRVHGGYSVIWNLHGIVDRLLKTGIKRQWINLLLLRCSFGGGCRGAAFRLL